MFPLVIYLIYYHIEEKQKKSRVKRNLAYIKLRVTLRKMSLFVLLLMLACFSSFKTICESRILVPFWDVLNSLLLLDYVMSVKNFVVNIM